MSNRLFIALYLDEDVDILVARLLRARGYHVTTTVEAEQLGAHDASQLEFATASQLTLLTHNRVDFEHLIRQRFLAGMAHCGVVIATRHSPQEIVRRLLIVLDSTTADEMNDQVRYI